MFETLIASGVFDVAKSLIDKLIPDPQANAAAQLELMRLDQAGQLNELTIRMSAILAEANSQDPWTSRARPSFLYLFYIIVMFMVMMAPMIGVFFPDKMAAFFANVTLGFNAIPEPMWWTFSAGFLGYTGGKTIEAVKGVKGPGK
jgi:hypothetical protein